MDIPFWRVYQIVYVSVQLTHKVGSILARALDHY
jgi:hypothetical protein